MVSKALRAEFARGDGRIKRKEDERRKKIAPSETLFVVNFHEETTKREDLEMLFSPFGELVRIDMKRNYAFVQFRTTEQAQTAKDATNGGKLDQSEITVEFVARRMGEGGGRDRRRDDYRGPRRDYDRRRDDYRGPRRDYDRRRDDYRPRRDYRDRSRSRSRSPPGYRYDRRRSRSRSPEDRYRPSSSYRRNSRSPGRRDYDDRRGRDGGRDAGEGGRGYSSRGYGEEGR